MSKKETAAKIKTDKSGFVKYIISGIILVAALLLFAPAAEVFRTIPLVAVAGAVVCVLGASVKYMSVFSAVLTLCIYVFSGMDMLQAAVFAAVAAVQFLLGAFAARLVVLCRKTENKAVKKKAAVLGAGCIIVLLAINLLTCGNIASFMICDAANTKYVSDNYGDSAEKKFTMYSLVSGEYRTYVVFNDGDYVYGNNFDCYVSSKDEKIHDGVKEHYINKLLDETELELARIVAGVKSGFYVVDSKLMCETEGVSFMNGIDPYRKNAGYVLNYDSLISENDKDSFEKACYEAFTEIMSQDFCYDSMVFCAGRSDKVIFTVTVTPETVPEEIFGSAEVFDESHISNYDLTQDDVLKYWQNQ